MDDYPPSIFDRLTDPGIPLGRCRYSLQELEQSVLRDLAELLNTKRPTADSFVGLDLVPGSIVNYGLRDMTMVEASTPTARESYAQHILQVIQVYEPRLSEVVVIARDPNEVREERPQQFNMAALYFRIRATLNVDPTPIEGVTFDTICELTSGHHQVHLPRTTT